MPNRLADETSPYLHQHADNPVDWYPWGAEAFARARSEDRPILLSIGYSACHWCHVMAHESFEDGPTAALMNELFVNIKVDREEHPDVDQVYQQALQAFSEHGGWPLTMFLTPAGEPYFGGTYFPPKEAYGRPSFQRVLRSLAGVYRDRHAEVVEQAQNVVALLARAQGRAATAGEPAPIPRDFTIRAAAKLAARMDPREGGFGGAPKFPNPTALALLLRGAARAGDPAAAEPVLLTLTRMAEGGIYDQLGGGFARYSTDEHWLVPHFEKMLYDNGLLLGLLAAGHTLAQAAGQGQRAALFSRVARETLGWLEREMRDPAGGLYAAQDADSEGVEGKYFVFTPAEVEALCGPAAPVVQRCLDVRPGGNWRDPHGHAPPGASILHVVDAPRDEAEAALLAAGKAALLAARLLRVPPGTDDKVLAGWNGLMIGGLSEVGRVLGLPEALAAARRTADFVLGHMRDEGGGLLRTYKAGRARLPGTLDDHAFLADGLCLLAGATAELRYLDEAALLMDAVLSHLYDPATHAFYLAPPAAAGEVPLVVRPVSLNDSAVPSGLSVTCHCLLRLAALLGGERGQRYAEVAEETLRRMAEPALSSPFGFSHLASAVDLWQHGLTTVVIVHDGTAGGQGLAARLRAATASVYVPDLFVLLGAQAPAAPGAETAAGIAGHFQGRPPGPAGAAAYVCQGPRCALPVHTPEALTALLREQVQT